MENDRQLAVVKYGSSSVTSGEAGTMENVQRNIDSFAYQISKLHKEYDLIVVTSGAVAIGRSRCSDLSGQSREDTEQFFAMNGNPKLMNTWMDSLDKYGIKSAELLLTHRDIEDDKRPDSPGSEMRSALERNLALSAITLINENDALSRRELAELHYGGDNDGLASHIAISFGARVLYLMTETNGVLGRRSRMHQIQPSEKSWNNAREYARGTNSQGRGGMKTKVEAAISAAQNGIDAYIAPAHKASFASIRSGKFGTHFKPVKSKTIVE